MVLAPRSQRPLELRIPNLLNIACAGNSNRSSFTSFEPLAVVSVGLEHTVTASEVDEGVNKVVQLDELDHAGHKLL
jgi:hypothetical protein